MILSTWVWVCCSLKTAPSKMVKFMENELNMNLKSFRITTSFICRIKPAGVCHKKDLVMIRSHLRPGSFVLAEVWFHAAIDCEHVSLVNTYSILGDDESSGTSDWQAQHHPLFISTEDIFTSVCYRKPTATTVKVIAPYQFRGLRPANDWLALLLAFHVTSQRCCSFYFCGCSFARWYWKQPYGFYMSTYNKSIGISVAKSIWHQQHVANLIQFRHLTKHLAKSPKSPPHLGPHLAKSLTNLLAKRCDG